MNNEDIRNFFGDMEVRIWRNPLLREPQIDGYLAIRDHFHQNNEPCYVQLPVGCGKTGLISLTPFGIATGRVLVIAPNLTIRDTIRRELNITDPNCFFIKRNVFKPTNGPFLSDLKTGANIHDCDTAMLPTSSSPTSSNSVVLRTDGTRHSHKIIFT
jgi:hypothetical protein